MTLLNRWLKRIKYSLKPKSNPLDVSKSFLEEKCTFCLYDAEALYHCEYFDCGHKDLNEFFSKDSINYSNEFFGKTYCFTLDSSPKTIIAAFTVANDSIKTTWLPNARKSKLQILIPHEKIMRSYPAVLIGRFGVNIILLRSGVGCEVMDFIKSWFIEPKNKTGCRFLVVDAYNEEIPIKFYSKNGFSFLFNTEPQEKEYLNIPENMPLKTRLMYFDLIKIKPYTA